MALRVIELLGAPSSARSPCSLNPTFWEAYSPRRTICLNEGCLLRGKAGLVGRHNVLSYRNGYSDLIFSNLRKKEGKILPRLKF